MASPPADLAIMGCDRDILSRLDPGLSGDGPMRLAAVACVPLESNAPPILSPDGSHLAEWPFEPPWPVRIAGLLKPTRVDVPNRVTFQSFGVLGPPNTAPETLAWNSDSRSLWAVRQETVYPSGFALSGLRPIRIGLDGKARELPALGHPAGPLDALRWIGGKGLAIAQFGAKGGYYRPEHKDSAPTLAMVDAARGKVLASFPAASVEALRKRAQTRVLIVGSATGTILPDGRIKAVLHFWPWQESRPDGSRASPARHPAVLLSWTQGEKPVAWASPYDNFYGEAPVLTPDGSRLLASRPLHEEGLVVTSCRIRCLHPGPPPKPVSGPVAELYDLAARRTLWSVQGRALGHWRAGAAPAISDDGRYALIELPPDGDRLPVALISMRDGRILQRLLVSHVGSVQQTFGFVRGGRRIWHAWGGVIRTYDLRFR